MLEKPLIWGVNWMWLAIFRDYGRKRIFTPIIELSIIALTPKTILN
jgi:hypothetical protein